MQWSERAIILSVRKLGESSAIIKVITPSNGVYSGVVKNISSKANRGIYQIGNIVSANWRARLSEQIGMMSCEMLKPVASMLLDSRLKLAVINSATSLTEKILPERESHELIFNSMERMLTSLCVDGGYLKDYVMLEFNLLKASGFGIDITSCAATGTTDNLVYVSPRSGRAVSSEAGMPYHDKLLLLPAFLSNETSEKVNIPEIMQGIRLCGYFLNARFFTHSNIILPAARERLINMIQKTEALAFDHI